jgi:hypothetical protein
LTNHQALHLNQENMPLHTADAPGDLESGGHQSQVNNIQLAYTLMELGSLETNEEVKTVMTTLGSEYMNLIYYLYDKHLEMRSRDVKAVAEYLTTLAVVVRLAIIHL